MTALRVESVQQLREREVLSALDLHFARAMGRLAGEDDPRVLVAAAMVSRQARMGHVCVDIPELAGSQLTLDLEDEPIELRWPDATAWLAALRASPLVGGEASVTPLVLERTRLYLRRYHRHERALADALERRLRRRVEPIDRAALEQGLERLFPRVPHPPAPAGAPKRRRRPVDDAQLDLFDRAASDDTLASGGHDAHDAQRAAARAAVERAFCVISGGPGTGKTSTVAKILALLVEQSRARGLPPPRVHLMAPTGKAAARLSESIAHAKRELRCAAEVRDAIEERASTIHRALGSLAGGRGFRRDRRSPLATDLVVVDEASMVDLALMARLCDAVPDAARLILLGDQNQLASVEAGAVLGDICGAGVEGAESGGRSSRAIAGAVTRLTRSYRYAEGSGIARFARAVLAGDAEAALGALADPALPDVELVDEPPPAGQLHGRLRDEVVRGFAPALHAGDPEARLAALSGFRVLCAHRHGAQGLLALNPEIESALRRAGHIRGAGELYDGRPILVTQNDYRAGLYNGDVGVLERVAGPDDTWRAVACFATAKGLSRVAAVRLPAHESVFAMSVHKSQGSEFDRVAIVLPAEPSPVLSRELLYTAITRARQGVVLFARREIVRHAVRTRVRRASGLGKRLWGTG